MSDGSPDPDALNLERQIFELSLQSALEISTLVSSLVSSYERRLWILMAGVTC